MAVEGRLAVPSSILWRRIRERVNLWRRLFLLNWGLFRASRIGVVGLAIMIAFVLLALAAPFMGLRDPIRWTAPDEDLIDVDRFWESGTVVPGSELSISPPVTQPVAYRVLPKGSEPRSDRVYVAATDRVYALNTRIDVGGANAWVPTQFRRYINVSRDVDDLPRTISTAPVAMNYGDFERELADYEIYVGTDDGTLIIFRDAGIETPTPEPAIRLSGRVTGLAAFNGDMRGVDTVIGRANYLTFNESAGLWEWTELPGAPFGDEGEYASLALNITGPTVQPMIAFYDASKGLPKISAWMGDRWGFAAGGEEIEPYTPDPRTNVGNFTSIAVGAGDKLPRVAYYSQVMRSVKFARWNRVAWNISQVDSAGDVGRHVSMALNASDGIHLAYYNATGGWLKYAAGNGTAWTFEVVDSTPGADVGRFASLALNGSGVPHVAYYDATARTLKYATRLAPLVWSNVTVDAGGVGMHASLAISPTTGWPAIAYYDQTRQSLKFAGWNGATWVLEDVDSGGVGEYAALAFDPAGNPAIAYYDATNFDLKYANRTGGAWSNVTIASGGHIGLHNSLKFDPQGSPHIASYSFVAGRTTRDMLLAGTADGHLYAVDVGIPGGFLWRDRGKEVARWDYRIRWNVSVGSEVHLAAAPLRRDQSVPIVSPAINRGGSAVFLGTLDGRLVALNTSDGGNYWWNASSPSLSIGAPWRGAPVVYRAAEGPSNGRELVYAGSSSVDANGDGFPESLLYVRDAETNEPLAQWLQEFGGFDGAAFIGPTNVTADGGDLTQPVVEGDTIYFGSTSGRLYGIRRDGYGEYPNWAIPPGSVAWVYKDDTLLGLEPQFTYPVVVVGDRQILLGVANHNNGTADPSDDRGVLYSIRVDDGTLSWKRSLPASALGVPSTWMAPNPALNPSVWAAYGGRQWGVISLSSVGKFLAPSPPSWIQPYPSGNQYWLGLDSQGRDIFSQVIWGSRIALLVGFLSAFFTVLLGVIVGLIAGYVGGKVESILMRFTDVILVLPGLPLIITLSAVLGSSIWNIILVISLLGWPAVARIIRAEVLSLKERPFIDSARVTGASTTRVVFKHIAPNVMPLAFLFMTFSVSGAILTEAALSFIGLGDISTMSWGIMLQLVSQSKALTAWWWLLPPGLAITLISLAFFLVGRAFDEIVNPRLRKR